MRRMRSAAPPEPAERPLAAQSQAERPAQPRILLAEALVLVAEARALRPRVVEEGAHLEPLRLELAEHLEVERAHVLVQRGAHVGEPAVERRLQRLGVAPLGRADQPRARLGEM